MLGAFIETLRCISKLGITCICVPFKKKKKIIGITLFSASLCLFKTDFALYVYVLHNASSRRDKVALKEKRTKTRKAFVVCKMFIIND